MSNHTEFRELLESTPRLSLLLVYPTDVSATVPKALPERTCQRECVTWDVGECGPGSGVLPRWGSVTVIHRASYLFRNGVQDSLNFAFQINIRKES
jgi:hypothetical protein